MKHESYPDAHHDTYSKTIFGFWIYLLTDFMTFGTLFAAYEVFRHSTFGGPGAKELFDLQHAFIQSVILLIAAGTAGIGGAYAHRRHKWATIIFFLLTFILGAVFFVMQYEEFHFLLANGHHWGNSAYLTAYFTLVGTHFLHVAIALLWVIVLLPPLFRFGVTPQSVKRLTCLRMFWQFVNFVWIFIFANVYLMGAG